MTNYFAKNIKYFRTKKNIDQQIMAEDLGVAQSTLSCWESGIRVPDLNMIIKIAKYLNIYDDFISKDLTIGNDSPADDFDLLFSKNKDILTNEDKEYIRFIIEKRRKEIDKELGEKNDN